MGVITSSLAMTLMGVMLIGLIHNPRTMAIGLVLLIISQSLMFYSGFRKGSGNKTKTSS